MAILESQLAQAKQIAEEADKKYEEVREGHNNCALNFRWRCRCPSRCCLHGFNGAHVGGWLWLMILSVLMTNG